MNIGGILKEYIAVLSARLTVFDSACPKESIEVPLDRFGEKLLERFYFAGAEWELDYDIEDIDKWKDIFEISVSLRLLRGSASNVSLSIVFRFNGWDKENYVLIPGAAYNGNRFDCKPTPYHQMTDSGDVLKIQEICISDIPRLSKEEIESSIRILAGDCATPCAGFYSDKRKYSFLLFANQNTSYGENGISVEEATNKKICEFIVSTPGIRTGKIYNHEGGNLGLNKDSDDEATGIDQGKVISLKVRSSFENCNHLQQLFDLYFESRNDFIRDPICLKNVPMSETFKILQEKCNNKNWNDTSGYFTLANNNITDDLQAGYFGGGIIALPLLIAGDEVSEKRAIKNLNYIFDNLQTESGFFLAGNSNVNEKSSIHTGQAANFLYYLTRAVYMVQIKDESLLNQCWLDGLRKCAESFVRLWNKYGQIGQWIDVKKEIIIVNGTSAASILPAALCLCGKLLGELKYIDIAEEIGEYFYKEFLQVGVTNGGSIYSLQCPDSSSAYNMLEAFTVLYEANGEAKWLTKACEAAAQFSTWCINYDYDFPTSSIFAKRNIKSAGTIIEDIQHKHSMPCIPISSGSALLRLFKYADDKRYLDMLRLTAHNMVQYFLILENHCEDEKSKINHNMVERINISDWQGKDQIGEIIHGSSLCEISAMLTYAQVPGLYIQPDTGLVCAIDNVDAKVLDRKNGKLRVVITNPTNYKAKVKVMLEPSNKILDEAYFLKFKTLELNPNETKVESY